MRSMDRPKTSHSWISAFAARLMQLEPSLPPGTAIQLAVHNHEFAQTLSPELAAHEFVNSQIAEAAAAAATPGVPSAPPRRRSLRFWRR